MVPARMRLGCRWDDACILNISPHGLLIHVREPLLRGSYVELRRGPYVIVARVVWGEGGRAGLRAQDRMPVEQIVTLAGAPGQPTAPATAPLRFERRSRPRSHEGNRQLGRAMEFACFAVIGLFASTAVLAFVAEALARPLAQVRAALGS
jgi:hypothetical protein